MFAVTDDIMNKLTYIKCFGILDNIMAVIQQFINNQYIFSKQSTKMAVPQLIAAQSTSPQSRIASFMTGIQFTAITYQYFISFRTLLTHITLKIKLPIPIIFLFIIKLLLFYPILITIMIIKLAISPAVWTFT